MDAHRGKSKGEAVSLSASLSAFVDLFEFFSDTLRDLRGRRSTPISEPWQEYFGDDSPSFEEVLDETALAVLEFQLRLQTLLTETRLEELTPQGDDPFALSDEATRYRKRAEAKLKDLYDRVRTVRNQLGQEELEEQKTAPKLQSESGLKLDLLIEREEDEATEEFVGVEPDNALREAAAEEDGIIGAAEVVTFSEIAGTESEVETAESVDHAKDVFNDEQTALVESKKVIMGEEPSEIPDEIPSAESEQQEMESNTDGDDIEALSEASVPDESEQGRQVTQVPEPEEGTESAEEAEETYKAEEVERVVETKEADEAEEIEKAEVSEVIGPKPVSTEHMVGVGRYDSSDRPDNGDRKKREQERDSHPSASQASKDEREELNSLEVPPPPARRTDYGEEGVPLFTESSIMKDRIDTLLKRVSRLKKVHRDAADLKVKTVGGAWTLSLPYFYGINGSGQPAALLDLENFIGIHNLAFRGVLDAATKRENKDSDPRMLKLVQKLHTYFRRLYGNISAVIGPHGSRILPDTGESLEPDVFLLLEADLVLFGWKSTEDVCHFRDIFQKMLAKPFNEYVTGSRNKLAYLESVADLIEPGDERSSAEG